MKTQHNEREESNVNENYIDEKVFNENELQLNQEDVKPLPPPKLEKLPKFTNNLTGNASVFTNRFIEEENAKQAMLEKHVKMVNLKDNAKTINGKKICWNYRKGRCRFGHNCKYAHDSDLEKSEEQLRFEKQTQQVILFQSQNMPQANNEEINAIKEAAIADSKKRKRPGLTEGIVPGKRVMNNYFNQKHKV